MDFKNLRRVYPWAIALGAVLSGTIVQAKIVTYSFADKTRNSALIVVGKVTKLNENSVTLSVQRTLKGKAPSAEIEIPWNKQGNIEWAPVKYKLGDNVFVFANETNGKLQPMGLGAQGAEPVNDDAATQYESSVKKIQKYDAAQSPSEKAKIVAEMLQGSPVDQRTALVDILYLDTKRDRVPSASLVPHVLRLAKGKDRATAVPAVQVLGRIGDKAEVPELIELLDSPDGHVAQTASRVLRDLTQNKSDVSPQETPEKRREAKAKWREWWKQNKDKVKLRK